MHLRHKVQMAFMATAAGGFLTALLASDSYSGRVVAFAVLLAGSLVGATVATRGPQEDET